MMLDDSFNLLLTPNPKQNEEQVIKPPINTCKEQYLLKSNFLSEFLTKSEKQKVLNNLGIYELAGGGNWGSIVGNIKEQTDLINYISNPLNVKYDSVDNPDISNIKEALDKVLYTPLSISISINPAMAELGTTVNEINVMWQLNKSKIVSQTLNGLSIPNDKRNYVVRTPCNTNQTYTLKVIDSAKDYTKSITLEFVPAIYYGDFDSIPTLPITSKLLTKSRQCTLSINAYKYIYIFIPINYGTPSFYVGGFEGGFQKVGTTIYNTTQYSIYRSDNANLGQTTIVIK